MKDDTNLVGICIDNVPNKLGDGQDRFSHLGKPLQVIVLDLNFDRFHRHALPKTRCRVLPAARILGHRHTR